MAIGVFKLTSRQRFYLGIAFTVLNILQVTFGIVTTGWSIHICVNVSPNLYSEKGEIKFVFTVTGLYGTHVMIHYLIGIKICDKCYHKAHKKSTRYHLMIWTLVCCNTILNIFILATMAVKTSKHIVRSLRHSIEKGMKHYLKNEEWKYTIDNWQFKMQCCGVNSYDDWFQISWLDKFQVNVETDIIKQYKLSNDHLLLPILPWSCCRLDFPMQCFHDPLQQIQSQHVWAEQPNLVLESINTDGCLNVLREPIENAIVGFIVISAFLIITQVFIICISRLLYTSCRNAIILGCPDGISPGWIFGREGAIKSGKTLSEILLGLGMELEDIPRYQELTAKQEVTKQEKNQETEPEPETASKNEGKKKLKFSLLAKLAVKKKKPVSPRSDSAPVSTGEEDALMLK